MIADRRAAGRHQQIGADGALGHGLQSGAIVGRDGGFTATVADACVLIPTVNAETITPHTEAFQAVVWHLIVSHPRLKRNEMKWESLGVR